MSFRFENKMLYGYSHSGVEESQQDASGYVANFTSAVGYSVSVAGHSSGQPEVMQQITNYPFGYTLEQIIYYSLWSEMNKNLYNGKELQDDELGGVRLDWYDYGARFYDPQIGRWNSVDPLAEDFPSWTPYHYCHNNPIVLINPDGRSADWYQSERGAFLWKDENKLQITVNGEKFNNVGTSDSIGTGDENYINYYQNGPVSISNAPVNAQETVLNNDGLKVQLLSRNSPLSEKSQVGLMTASIHKGQQDFLNHPVTKATVNTLLFVATGGIEGAVSLASSGSKLLPNIKLLKGKVGEVNGLSISRGGYGAKPRFDVHPLGHASKASNCMPKWTKGRTLPHYHRGAGNNLHRHRPWEEGWNDKSFFDRY